MYKDICSMLTRHVKYYIITIITLLLSYYLQCVIIYSDKMKILPSVNFCLFLQASYSLILKTHSYNHNGNNGSFSHQPPCAQRDDAVDSPALITCN